MDAFVNRSAATRPLELLGIGVAEERAYRALLERHMATAAEIAARLGVSLRVVRRLLADLERLGLATHTPKVPRVYVAAPPEFAVAALIQRQQAMLERVRIAIPGLEAQSARASHATGQQPVLEVIASQTQLRVVMAQLYESFHSEVMWFQRAPLLLPAARLPRKAQSDVRIREISDDSVFAIPGALARIRGDVARGDEARMLPLLPFRMMVFDRRAAVISLDGGKSEAGPALLIHGGALLRALCLLFEFVWERATPILLARTENPQSNIPGVRSDGAFDALLALLAAGLNDKAIAMELGISSATLNRRMGKLMRACGVRTRFQLGWHAALKAALPEASTLESAAE